MIIKDQTVLVKWGTRNKIYYTELGYEYTKMNDPFYVKLEDLPKTSNLIVEVVCDYCNNKYSTSYSLLHNGKHACSNCSYKKATELRNARNSLKKYNELKEVCSQKGYTLLFSPNDYKGVKMQVDFLCPKHGKKSMILDNLLRGHECFECSYENRCDNMRHSSSEVESRINSVNGNILLNACEYKNAMVRNLRIKCSCGNVFTTSFSNYIRAEVNRCPKCTQKESCGEVKIRNFLELYHIDYVQEKRFNDCRDKRTLPFDFYLPSYNMCIEFDGKQHFESVFGEDSFVRTQEHDRIKNEFCKNQGITLLRIPYWGGSAIEDVLLDAIS